MTWEEQTEDYFSKHPKRLSMHDDLYIMDSDPDLIRLGLGQKPVFMLKSNMKKSTRDTAHSTASAHGVPKSVIQKLPELIKNPALVIIGQGRISVISDEKVKTSRNDSAPLLIDIDPNSMVDGMSANEVKSIYGLDDFGKWLNARLTDSSILSGNANKATALLRHLGLQLSHAVAYADDLTPMILSHANNNVNNKTAYVYRGANEGVMPDVGYAMFADSEDLAEGYSGGHGKMYRVPVDKLTPIEEMQEPIALEWDFGTSKYNYDLDFLFDVSGKEISEMFNPEDIIMSADAWDNSDLVQWAYENVEGFADNSGYKTQDGGVITDPSISEEYKNPYTSGKAIVSEPQEEWNQRFNEIYSADEDITGKLSMSEYERNRALKKGEMRNDFFDKINWREYYQKILNEKYNPKYYGDGETVVLELNGQSLLLEMQRNGEFSVIKILEGYDETDKEDYGGAAKTDGGARLSGNGYGFGTRSDKVFSESGRDSTGDSRNSKERSNSPRSDSRNSALLEKALLKDGNPTKLSLSQVGGEATTPPTADEFSSMSYAGNKEIKEELPSAAFGNDAASAMFWSSSGSNYNTTLTDVNSKDSASEPMKLTLPTVDNSQYSMSYVGDPNADEDYTDVEAESELNTDRLHRLTVQAVIMMISVVFCVYLEIAL